MLKRIDLLIVIIVWLFILFTSLLKVHNASYINGSILIFYGLWGFFRKKIYLKLEVFEGKYVIIVSLMYIAFGATMLLRQFLN